LPQSQSGTVRTFGHRAGGLAHFRSGQARHAAGMASSLFAGRDDDPGWR
jgi:hypothetical protein